MKRLVTASLCLLLAQTGAACIIVDDGQSGGQSGGNGGQTTDPNGGSAPGIANLQVVWDLVTGDDNTIATCPEAAASVQVVVEPVGDGDETLGDGDELDIGFACADGAGIIENLAPGPYQVWVDIIDEAGALLAQSRIQDVELIAGDQADLAYTISLDRGSFGLAWTITDGATTLTCEDAGAVTIWVISTHAETGEELYDSFPCTDGEGFTLGLPIGSYEVEVSLLDDRNLAIGPPIVLQGTIEFGSDYENLGSLELQLGQ